jgi:two-component system, response regulator PdtaR
MSSGRPDPLRILIVEDEFFIALDLQAIAEGEGHAVLAIATSASEAVKEAGNLRPDVVLMDVRLAQNSDGIEAAREIKDRYGIRSLFITANSDEGTRRRAALVDPLDFLEKPVTQATLRRVLQRV